MVAGQQCTGMIGLGRVGAPGAYQLNMRVAAKTVKAGRW